MQSDEGRAEAPYRCFTTPPQIQPPPRPATILGCNTSAPLSSHSTHTHTRALVLPKALVMLTSNAMNCITLRCFRNSLVLLLLLFFCHGYHLALIFAWMVHLIISESASHKWIDYLKFIVDLENLGVPSFGWASRAHITDASVDRPPAWDVSCCQWAEKSTVWLSHFETRRYTLDGCTVYVAWDIPDHGHSRTNLKTLLHVCIRTSQLRKYCTVYFQLYEMTPSQQKMANRRNHIPHYVPFPLKGKHLWLIWTRF